MKIGILLADDHQIVLEGLRKLIEGRPDMEVVGEAYSGREAVKLAQEKRPGVVIMDISMPGLNGIEATRRILSLLPETKVIALSMYSDRRFVAGMLQAGARGFLLKAGAFSELMDAIETVLKGKTYLSGSIAEVVVEDYVRSLPEQLEETSRALTSREREVVQLLAEGHSVREIADRLCVSIKTVHSHRYQIMEKLKVKNTAQLIKYAIREGITSPEP